MPGSTGAGQPGVTGGTGGLYQWHPPGWVPPPPSPPVPVGHHRHFHGLGGLGTFDPLGIGIDFSDPVVLGITALAVYFLFFKKKGRGKGLF